MKFKNKIIISFCIIIFVPIFLATLVLFSMQHIQMRAIEQTYGVEGVLGYFKYTNFLVDIANQMFGQGFLQFQNIFLPVGISFFVFQSISYTVPGKPASATLSSLPSLMSRYDTRSLLIPHI